MRKVTLALHGVEPFHVSVSFRIIGENMCCGIPHSIKLCVCGTITIERNQVFTFWTVYMGQALY